MSAKVNSQKMPLFFFANRVNLAVSRLVAFQVFLVTLLLLIFGEGSGTPGQTGQWCVSLRLRLSTRVVLAGQIARARCLARLRACVRCRPAAPV
jgi:hypothetical protein